MSVEYAKDVLLALLYAADETGEAAPIRGRTRLQKLLFLLGEEHGIGDSVPDYYHFSAYKFGPFARDIYDDIEFFENIGLIEEEQGDVPVSLPEAFEANEAIGGAVAADEIDDSPGQTTEPRYRLTEKGKRIVEERVWRSLPADVRDSIEELKRRHNRKPLAALLRYVYTRHPEYAENSELEWLKP